MKSRHLGKLEVSEIGYGCMGLSHAYGVALDEKLAISRIKQAFEEGYKFFDTAEVYVGQYSDGSKAINEEIVGKAIQDIRDEVMIATKGGITLKDKSYPDGTRDSFRKSVEQSLNRLNTDYIDLYYQHRIDPNVEPETVANTMVELIDEGKIKHWGISNAPAEYIERADDVCKVSAVQVRYSMMYRKTEELFDMLEKRNIGFVAFSPIANGFLSGKIQSADNYDSKLDFRSFMPQYKKKGVAKNNEVLEMLAEIAQDKKATLAQISLAWMLSKKDYIVPIPGTKNPERIIENAKSGEIKFSNDEIKRIDDKLNNMRFEVFEGL